MPSTAYLPIVADRYGALVRHVFLVGLDLSGLEMRAQVRLGGDTPGAPLIDLRTVSNGNAEGLRLVEVTADKDGLPTSHVELVVNESTMERLPFLGEIGDASQFAWDWQVTIAGRKRRLAKGEFEVTGDGVTGADGASGNRIVGTGRPRRPIRDVWSSARLTFGEEQVTVTIDGADLIAPLAGRAETAALRAESSQAGAANAAAAAQAVSRYYTTRAAGEAASAVNQSFATDDGAGSVIYYRRTAGGSVEIGRAVTPGALAASAGAGLIGFDGRTVQSKLREIVSVTDRRFAGGADPTGQSSAVAAFNAALAAGKRVAGAPGDVYLLDAPVVVPSDREIIGNGATLKLGAGATGLRLNNDRCKVGGWTILGNGGLYGVHDTGDFNEFFENLCTGDIGHFYFASGAVHPKVRDCRVEGRTASTEITTAFVFERCRHVSVNGITSQDIPIGWCVQIRDASEDFSVAGCNIVQSKFSDTKTATAGQTTFTFTLAAPDGFQSPCFLRKVQINGKPLSTGYAVTGTGPTYTVTFAAGRTAGERVSLVGYRGAENIQTNSGAHHGSITGNVCDGTADSGIIVHGSHIAVTGNTVRNAGYVGIAIYGDQDNVTVTGNTISDCAQMDDGMSSPDFPDLPSVFAGAILCSGVNATVTGNTITNAAGTMRYGVRFNKSDMALRTDGSATMTASANTFSGEFIDGRHYAPQDTTGQRVKSIAVDGPLIRYPAVLDLDQRWGVPAPSPDQEAQYPAYPPSDAYFGVSGSGGTRATRDMVTKLGGTASLRTVPGQYIDFDLLAAAMLYGCNVDVSFWAKSNGGLSYLAIFTTLAGLRAPLRVNVTDTTWKQYSVSFPLVPNLERSILLRIGADVLNTGGPESANFQHIQISGRRL